MPDYSPNGTGFINVDGQLVEADALRIAEALKDHDENLEILCNTRPSGPSEAPFIICERVGGELRPIFEAWELDDRVITRVQLSDTSKRNVLADLEAQEAKIRSDQQSRYRDFMDSSKDLVKHVARNRKSKYSFRDSVTGDIITFYEDRPTERKIANG